ncbi:MAG: hypothetical protein DRO12_00705 [Thermoprotei archaeon]|nr:MAG: hypothetical protein DRO12_00705 [Thermoprotei archaeon]
MRLNEGCWFTPIYEIIKGGDKLIEAIFEKSKTEPIFIALKPTIIPTKLKGRRTAIAIAPLTVITCSERLVPNSIIATEPLWIDTAILIPYARSREDNECFSTIFGLELPVDTELGASCNILRCSPTPSIEKLVKLAQDMRKGVICVADADMHEDKVAIRSATHPLAKISLDLVGEKASCVCCLDVEEAIPWIEPILIHGQNGHHLVLGEILSNVLVFHEDTGKKLRYILSLYTLSEEMSSTLARVYTSFLKRGF